MLLKKPHANVHIPASFSCPGENGFFFSGGLCHSSCGLGQDELAIHAKDEECFSMSCLLGFHSISLVYVQFKGGALFLFKMLLEFNIQAAGFFVLGVELALAGALGGTKNAESRLAVDGGMGLGIPAQCLRDRLERKQKAMLRAPAIST